MKNISLFIATLFFIQITFASTINKPNSSRFGFIENKGQIIDQNNNLNPAVKYLFNSNGLNVQLRANGFSYDTYRRDAGSHRRASGSQLLASGSKMPAASSQLPTANQELTADNIFFHRVDIEFINANKNPQIFSEQPSSDYTNYYTTGTPEEGVTNVRTFQSVTYKNIYSGIDLQFSTPPNLPPEKVGINSGEGLVTAQGNSPLLWRGAGGAVKFNFVVHLGADVSQIHWKYSGAFSTTLTDGKIILQLAQGNLEEKIPESFLQESLEKVNVNYISFGDNEFGFSASFFNKNSTLVIDPVPWATYFGGSGDEQGLGISIDISGNTVITGSTTATTTIATTGAHQTTYGGGIYDAFIAKFNSSGSRLWGTYYGGSLDDKSFGISTDASGNILITGRTFSTSSIATTGAFQTTLGGNSDVFISKFNSSGSRLWGTYYGGNSIDAGNGISIDASGNIVVTGQAASTSGIATTGAYQTVNGGGYDAFIANFNTYGSLQWGTYYGGSGSDYGTGISIDASGNIVITGQTNSTSGVATTGTFQTTYGGGANDAFIAKFNSSGSSLLCGTYFGGSSGDNANGISIDASGNILITGSTLSTSGIATSGVFQTTYGVGMDGFLAKFNTSGSRLWGTYFGGNGDDYCYGISIDPSGNIVITGNTLSTSGIATTGAYQTSGGNDAFIAKFNSSGSRLWCTYYGLIYTYGNGISIDTSGNIVITGTTGSASSIATAGAYQTTCGGGLDAFIAAFTPSGGLPVHLISFDAKLENRNEVICTWATASEVNNDYFQIEKSIDLPTGQAGNSSWIIAGKVKGNGTSNLKNEYQFTDNISSIQHPASSIYYRLKQVDFNGKYEYSNVVSVSLDKNNQNEIIVSPNPTANILNIQTNSNENYTAQLFDITGKLILQDSFIQLLTFNISDYPQGIYFLRISNENSGEVKMQKVVVMK